MCGLCAWALINCQYWIEWELCCVNNGNLFKSEAEWQKIRTFPTKLLDVCLPFSSCITDLFPPKKKRKEKHPCRIVIVQSAGGLQGRTVTACYFQAFCLFFLLLSHRFHPVRSGAKKKKKNTTKTKKQKSTVGSALTSEIIFQLLREPPLRYQCESLQK